MFKIAAVVSLMLIAPWSHADSPRRHKRDATPSGDFNPGSTLWAAGLSCESCGRECASACGTRHFRACCFNYLRRKRTDAGDVNKIWSKPHDSKQLEDHHHKRIPILAIENIEPWLTNVASNEIEPYQYEETIVNRLPFE